MPRLKLIASSKIPSKQAFSHSDINISADLEKIYHAAFDSGHYTAALKAKELQMKIQQYQINTEIDMSDHLCNLDDDQLKKIINMLEKKNLALNI